MAASVLLLHHALLFSGLHELHGDPGDTRFVEYALEHTWAFITGRAPSLFDAPFFAPARNVSAYSDLMLGAGPLYWLPRALGVDRDPAMALFCVFATALDALTFFLLLRKGLGRSPFASAAGTILFAAGLPRENYANHPQLFPLFFPAVAIWAAIEVFRQPPRRERVWLAILFAALTLQLYTAFYTAWFTGFSLGVAALIATALPASRERLREVLRNQWKTLLVCASVSAIVVAPLAIHYVDVARATGGRAWGEVLLPRLQTFINPGDSSWLYGWTGTLPLFSRLPVEGEQRGGIGFATTAVMLFVLWRQRRAPGLRVLALTTGTIILLTVLWRGGWSPWRVVFAIVPGANALRALSRFGIFLLIPGAISLATFVDEARTPRLLSVAIALFCLLEQQATIASFDARGPRANVAALAASVPNGCETFVAVPAGTARPSYEIQIDAMWAAYDRGVQTVNGYSGKVPPGYELESLNAPDIGARIGRWADRNQLTGLCTVKVTQ